MKKLLAITVFFIICYSSSFANIVEDLTELNNLYKSGAITEEQFKKAKDIIFKSNSNKNKSTKKKIKQKNNSNKKTNSSSKKNKKFNQDLTKTFISIEEIDELGTYKKIKFYPNKMFKKKRMSSKALAFKATQEMYKVFVQNKNLMEKYPENIMKAMAHFEVFYMQKLKDDKKFIDRFKANYPNINKKTKKKIKTLYTLNQARISMRKSIGLTNNDDIEQALRKYMHMYEFLSKGIRSANKLNKNQKEIKKLSNSFKKYYSTFIKTIENKSEKRITQKDFEKDLKKNITKIKNILQRLSIINNSISKPYKIVKEMFESSLSIIENCNYNCTRKDLLTVIDSNQFINTAIKDFEKNLIKKNYTHDLSHIEIETLSDNVKDTLAMASLSLKKQKEIDNKKLQSSILNLIYNNYPVEEYLVKFESDGFDIKSVAMSFNNINNMKNWKTEDWANSWRGQIPTDNIKDKKGNLIKLSAENIQDLKAQLAINNFSTMIDKSTFEINESMNEISQIVKNSIKGFNLDSWLNQEFSITLDNYVKLAVESQISNYGNLLDANTIKLIRDNANFENLTHLTNYQYGTNMSAQEYASYWEGAAVIGSTSNWGDITRGVDLLSQVGSFEAASIAKSLGTDLQTVADSIALAASVGVSTDLEAAAQGLGYGSFAEAVAAYNKQYGTNYTVEEAKEALGN